MESLLRWGIENVNTNDIGNQHPTEPRKELDPGIIDAILGKPDAVLMKEALAIGVDTSRDIDARVTALDNLEMLVEQIDNANNLAPLQMYPQILSLLTPQTPDQVRMQALWILGTAVQNNPQAQNEFLKYDPIPTILSILKPTSTSEAKSGEQPSAHTRSKAAYALSSTLRHNVPAVIRLGDVGGWGILKEALQDSEITIRRKIIFLFNTLLLPSTLPETSIAGSGQPTNIHHDIPQEALLHPLPSSRPSEATTITAESEGEHTHRVIPPLPIGLDPTSTSTSTLVALKSNNVIATLVQSLVAPVPHGPDADEEIDGDYAEKAAKTLVTFLEVGGELSSEDKSQLQSSVTNEATRAAWALDQHEWDTLRRGVLDT